MRHLDNISAVFAILLMLAAFSACDRAATSDSLPSEPSTPVPSGEAREAAEEDRRAKATARAVEVADQLAKMFQGRAVDVVVPDGARLTACGEVPDGMKCVTGGWFWRGVDDDPHRCDQPGQPRGDAPTTTPRERVWVSTFYMDDTEVTNAAYQACVKAGECPKSGPQYRDFDGPDQAITGVSWFDARAFCEAQGKRLPTEAEFEKAARGTEGWANPFGNEPVTCEDAIIKDSRGRSCGVRRNGPTPLTGRVMPVKSRPPGRYGLYDIVGNAEEWVADWFSRDWAACGDACRGVDPKGPCDGADDCPGYRNRAVRGGSWYWPAEHATGYHRRPHIPSNELFHHFGFRCAKSAPLGESAGESTGDTAKD